MFLFIDFVLSRGKYHRLAILILNLSFLRFLKAHPQLMHIGVFLLTGLYPCRSPASEL